MRTFVPERFQTGFASHPGKVRTQNEDAFLDHGGVGLWAVADGMGGHDDGHIASATLVEELRRIEPPASASKLLADCEASIVEANTRLLCEAYEHGLKIGTTLAVLLIYDDDYACIWSGDSRIYRVRDAAIQMMSRDHTEVQDLVDQGVMTEEEGRVSPRRHVITRAIGVSPEPELEIKQGVLAPGDIFILCSDGLTAHVEAFEMTAAVTRHSPQKASDALIALALDRGGEDNVTVVVVRHTDLPC